MTLFALGRLTRVSTRGLSAAVASLMIAAFVAVGFATWQFRKDVIEDSVAHVRNLSIVLSGQVERSIQSIDITLIDLLEHIALASVDSEDDLSKLVNSDYYQHLLRERLDRLPQVHGALIFGATGAPFTATYRNGKAANISDGDYFSEMKNDFAPGLAISLPVVNRATGVTNLVFARRIIGRTGAFIGVILIPMAVDYFESIYAPIKSVGSVRMTLARRDGTVVLRFPDFASAIGTSLPKSSPWYELVAKGGGEYRSPGYFDGKAAWFAIRPLPDYPLVLNVGISEGEMLARWNRRAISIAVGSITLMAFAGILHLMVLRQFRQLRTSEASLLEKSYDLAVSNMRFDSALNNISQGLCMFDADLRIVVSNARYAQIYGLSPDEVLPGTSLEEILNIRLLNGTYSGESPQIYLADLVNKPSEVQLLPDGRAIHIRRNRMADGGWMTTHEDITDRHRSETRIAFMARHDLLTGLFNRAAFSEKIAEAGARLRRFGESFTVLLLDLDRFKQVNDRLGHPAGDVLLKQTAERLRAALRGNRHPGPARRRRIRHHPGRCGRRSGRTRDRVRRADHRLHRRTVRSRRTERQRRAPASASRWRPSTAWSRTTLIRNADLALYRAKSEGRSGYSIFDVELMNVANARQQFEVELRDGARQGRVRAALPADRRRPDAGRSAASKRWCAGAIPAAACCLPGDFIPLAEETGLIEPIGEWVLRQACADAAAWPDTCRCVGQPVAGPVRPDRSGRGHPPTPWRRRGLPPRRLEIEITENVFLADGENNAVMVKQIKALGVSIALDDFGTGYSSLSYLTTFPFDKVKIDRTFTMNMTKRPDCAAVIASVITLTRCLGVTTTAEGVENRAQFELLSGAGIDFCQGYLFGRPTLAAGLDFTRVIELGRTVSAA